MDLYAFEEIKTGLNQAIEFEKGNLKAKTTKMTVEPLKIYTSEEIKSIRKKTGLSQNLFAKYMGVSIKTVEAWEAGKNRPNGTACRLLKITNQEPDFPSKYGIISPIL